VIRAVIIALSVVLITTIVCTKSTHDRIRNHRGTLFDPGRFAQNQTGSLNNRRNASLSFDGLALLALSMAGLMSLLTQ
jgi:hypothetical protein